MNYSWHYNKLISTRKAENRKKTRENLFQYEKHHIIMRSMGGDNSEDNLVLLTPREHFIAHLLMWKIHRNEKTAFAFSMMCRKKKDKLNISSRQYQEMREALSFAFSSLDRAGEKNSMWGKKHSPESIIKLKEKAKGRGIGASNSRVREIYQYDLLGNFLNKWTFAKECTDFYLAKRIHISRGNLSNTAKNNSNKNTNLKRVKEFVFSFSALDSDRFENTHFK